MTRNDGRFNRDRGGWAVEAIKCSPSNMNWLWFKARRSQKSLFPSKSPEFKVWPWIWIVVVGFYFGKFKSNLTLTTHFWSKFLKYIFLIIYLCLGYRFSWNLAQFLKKKFLLCLSILQKLNVQVRKRWRMWRKKKQFLMPQKSFFV